ncbi:MAG: hypothetical protein ACREV6_20460 [Clostridium sp.]|uniref:hypothetical protein n=1 Tax=Clostridium sp. TaxID=1506 RepID=UPI003D6CAB3E
MTPFMGISSVLAEMQNKFGSQFKDISGVAASMTPFMGISSVLAEMQNKFGSQFKDISGVAASMTPFMGISSALAEMQNKFGSQFKDISGVAASMTPFMGISSVLAEMQNNWGKYYKNVDFSNIRINENGTIDYLNETINIEDVVEEVNSYFIEDVSNQQEVEQNTEHHEKLNSKISIIIYAFLFVLFISIYPKSYNLPSEDNSIEHQIAENLADLNKNIEYGLEEMAKLSLFLFTLPIKCGGAIDDIATKYPGQYPLMLFMIPYIIGIIKYVAKKQKESIKYSD